MPKNLEIKVKLDSLNQVRKKLKKNGIGLSEVLYQKDIYFSVNKGLLKLRIENENQTLIYYNRNEKSEKRWSDYFLLDIKNTEGDKYFRRFLDIIVSVEKRRELFLYNDTRIHLDKVKNLGCFLELETRVLNALKDAEKRFNHLLDLLELKNQEEIRASYKDLLLNYKNNDFIKN